MKAIHECFHLPKDFQSRPEFRLLEIEAGLHMAVTAFVFLWRELAYLSEVQRLGFITKEQAYRAIDREFKKTEGNRFEVAPTDSLIRVRLLVESEDGFECRLFMTTNQHFAPDFMSSGKKGGFVSGLTAQRKKFDREANEQAGQFDRTIFVRQDGSAMSDDEMRRVLMLVKLIDNQYHRPQRMPHAFTAGLVADAYSVAMRYDDDTINGVCFWMATKREKRPGNFPLRTEEALREFDQLAKAFGRVANRKPRNAPAGVVYA